MGHIRLITCLFMVTYFYPTLCFGHLETSFSNAMDFSSRAEFFNTLIKQSATVYSCIVLGMASLVVSRTRPAQLSYQLSNFTNQQLHKHLQKNGSDRQAFRMYSLYQFPTFLTYL